MPQQRLWSKNDQLWGDKKEKYLTVTSNRLIPSSVSFFARFQKLKREKVLISFHANLLQKYTRDISLGKTKPFFNNQVNKTLCDQSTEFFKQTLSPIGSLANLLRKSFSHASQSIAFMFNRGSVKTFPAAEN